LNLLREPARDVNDDGWLFPAERGDGHFVGLPKVLARLCKAAKLKEVTVHTLRHSYASITAELGFSELVIAGLLGHSAGSVTSGYVHLDAALVAAADRVSTVIAEALDDRRSHVVLPLKRAVDA
jgi:site-specific recombinase XerD